MPLLLAFRQCDHNIFKLETNGRFNQLWNLWINPTNYQQNIIVMKIKIKILLTLCASRGNEKKLIYALNSRIIKI